MIITLNTQLPKSAPTAMSGACPRSGTALTPVTSSGSDVTVASRKRPDAGGAEPRVMAERFAVVGQPGTAKSDQSERSSEFEPDHGYAHRIAQCSRPVIRWYLVRMRDTGIASQSGEAA